MTHATHRFAVSLSLALAVLSGCGQQNPTALIDSAKSYLAKNDDKAAIIQLKTALQASPDSGEARFLLGQVLLDSGDPVAAEVELRKSLALKQPEAIVVPVLARALLAQGQAQSLIERYAAAEFSDAAANADIKTSLAAAYAIQGSPKQSDAALEAALHAVPGFKPALMLRARLAAAARDFDGAIKITDEILAAAPASYDALQLKGELLYFAKSNIDGALAAHRQALAIRKDFLPARLSVVILLLAKHDIPAAAAELDSLKVVVPNDIRVKFLQAQLAYQQHDDKAARELIQLVLKSAPENARALQLAGMIEWQSGATAQAQRLFAKSLQIAPSVVSTRGLLAQAYVRSRQFAKAIETLQPLLDKPDVDAGILSLAAQAQLQNGDPQAAEALFAQAAKKDPKDVKSRTALALGEFSKGREDLAYSQLQKLSTLDPGTFADMALVTTYLRQSKFDAALKAIDSLDHKQPDKPMASNLRGIALIGLKDSARARQSFEKALALDPKYFPAAASLASLDIADKKPQDAERRFDAVLAVDPKNIQALLSKADLKSKSGASREEVLKLINEAVRAEPDALSPRETLIAQLLQFKDPKAALVAAQDAIAAQPERPELLDVLGRVQATAGSTNQAISTFNKLAELQPESAMPQLRLADVYLRGSSKGDARKALEKALQISPGLLAAQRGLVMLDINEGRTEEALAMAKTIQASPGNAAIGLLLVGDAQSSQRNWPDAVAAYRAGLQKNASPEIAMKLHAALGNANQTAEADKLAATWMKSHPQDAAFLFYLGDRALSKPDYAAAEANYAAVVKLQADNAYALNNLAWVTNKLKKPGAIDLAERANRVEPDRAPFMDTLATILADNGQVTKAIEIEKKAISLQPDFHAYRLNLAQLYIHAGDKASAKTELDQLAKLGDRFNSQEEVSRLLKTL